jgi:glucokinase-like ROK family protein
MRTLQKATQQQTKSYNSRLVLKTIYDRRQVSRADVARMTNLTRTTVSDLVTELQGRGLVEEIGLGQSMGGRSPVLLSVVDNARHVISIDLGNDELRGAVVNLRNEVLETASLPIESRGGEEALASVYELVDRLVASTTQPLLGIGIGTPGLVDTTQGVVVRAVNLDWRNLPLGKLLEERYDLPVYVANDSQLAALARYMFGGDKYSANLVVMRVEHGIGAGIVLNGDLFQGDGYGAGEIGHIAVVEDGATCRCGNRGCLETVASVPAVLKRAATLAQSEPSSLLNKLTPSGESITVETLHQAFEARDPLALKVIEELGRYLGIAAAGLVGTLNVKHVAIASELACFGEPLADTIREIMVRKALPALAHETEIELIDSHPDIVILGAAALLLTNELGLSLVRE